MNKSFWAIFICFVFIHLSFGQTGGEVEQKLITIHSESIKVKNILKSISKQSGLEFSFNSKLIDLKRRISFKVKAVSLDTALETLTEKLAVRYSLVEDQIILNGRKDEIAPQPRKEFFTISGFLNDKSSGESLIGATVSVLGTNYGNYTNDFGFYSLRLPKGNHELMFSYLGYEVEKLAVKLEKDVKKDFALAMANIDLPAITVEIPLKAKMLARRLNQLELTPKDMERLPEFGGETGLVKGLQTLPGIKMHSDGSAFYFVRGGERDQNLVIIDDAPIYNPSHLFGFYSLVIPDFTKSIQIYKSDIPTNLGDRLSSITKIRTRDGNLNRWSLTGALNPLVSRFSLEVPIVKEKASIFTSLRTSNFNWLYKQTSPNASIGFGDFNFKYNHKLNNNNRIFLTTIFSKDEFRNKINATDPSIARSGIRWGNFAATLRWNHIYNSKLFSNTTLYTGTYAYELSFQESRWQSAIGTLSFKNDFTHYISPRFKAIFGIELSGHFINPGQLTTTRNSSFFPKIESNYSRKLAIYYQAEFKLKEKWDFSVGLRIPTWQNVGPAKYFSFDENYEVIDTTTVGRSVYGGTINLDPRFSGTYNIDSSSSIKLAVGNYHQYLQQISNAASPFSSLEIWLPSNPNIRPQQAFQIDLNYVKNFTKTKCTFSASAYYKKLNNQIDYAPHANTLLNPLVEAELRIGIMNAYGLEFMLQKKMGKLSGWINYTWSRAIRRTKDLNNNNPYPAFQDRPHDFSILLNYKPKDRFVLSTYFTAYTGSAFSSPTGFYQIDNRQIPIFGKKNNDRLPMYNRLDVAFKFILNKRSTAKFKHDLTFSIYNVLAHKNVIAVNFNKLPGADSRPEVPKNLNMVRTLSGTQLDLIRFFPSLTYKFKI